MRFKKVLAVASTLLLTAGLVTLGATSASAHSGFLNATAECNNADGSATVTWTLENDFHLVMSVTSSTNSAITVGSTVAATSGGGNTSATFTQNIPAPAAGVTASATLNLQWTDGYKQYNVSDSVKVSSKCKATVSTVPAVTFTDVCGTANDLVVGGTDTAEINYTITDTRVNGVGPVTATAAPQSGYVFASGAYTGPWSHDFTNTACPIEVKTVPAVTFTDVCGVANDAIVGGADTASIDYTITDNRVNGVGTVTVTAVPQPGYVFASGAYTGPWSHDFTDVACPIVVNTVPAASFTDVCGTTNDAIVGGVDTASIDYTVTDNRVNGVGTVTVTAAPQPGYLFAQGAYTGPWSHDFTDVACPIEVKTVPAATFTDVCGVDNDVIVGAVDTTEIDYTVTDNRAGGVGQVTVTAAPQPGYVFSQGVYTGPWSHYFTNDACPIVVPTVPAVTFTDVCGVDNDVIVGGTDTAEIDYTVTDNRVNGVGNVTVTAAPQAGYVFAKGAYTGPWSFDFTNTACIDVQPIAPKAFDPTCPEDEDAQSGYIVLDLKAGLHYYIDGVPTSLATNYVNPGNYTISVTVDQGYTLVGPASWKLVVNEPFCPPTLALLSTTASMKNLTCTAAGTYTLANTEGIQWFVNGSATPTPAGTYSVKGATTVNVEAKLIDTVNDGWEDGAQTHWTFTFTQPVDCLPTLAFTGANGSGLGLLLAGGFLLFGGTIIALERRFRPSAK